MSSEFQMTPPIHSRDQFAKYFSQKIGKQVDEWINRSYHSRAFLIDDIWQQFANQFDIRFSNGAIEGIFDFFVFVFVCFINCLTNYFVAILDSMPEIAVKKQNKILEDIDALKKQAMDKLDLLKNQATKVDKKRKTGSSSSSTSSTITSSNVSLATSSPVSKVEAKPEDLAFLNDVSASSSFFDDDDDYAKDSELSVESVSSLIQQRTPINQEATETSATVERSSSETLLEQSVEKSKPEEPKTKKRRIEAPKND